jgi:hypothetical protein
VSRLPISIDGIGVFEGAHEFAQSCLAIAVGRVGTAHRQPLGIAAMKHNKLEEGTIKCPHCDQLIPINSTLHQQLSEILKEEMEKDYDKRLTAEKQKWQSEAREKAGDAVSLELKDLRGQVAENKKTIGQYNEKELALLKKTRELEKREKNIELDTERRLAEEKRIVEEQTTKRVAGEYEAQLMETRKQLDDARKQAAELKRKTEQGSQ